MAGLTAEAASSRAERFPLANAAAWLPWGWLLLPALVVAAVVSQGADEPLASVAVVVWIATPLFYVWFAWRAWRSPQNFVQLNEAEMQIKVCGRAPIKVAYGEIASVQPATLVPVLERAMWMIERRGFPAHLQVQLDRPRWLALWIGPWRVTRLFLRPAAMADLDVALRGRLDRSRERAG